METIPIQFGIIDCNVNIIIVFIHKKYWDSKTFVPINYLEFMLQKIFQHKSLFLISNTNFNPLFYFNIFNYNDITGIPFYKEKISNLTYGISETGKLITQDDWFNNFYINGRNISTNEKDKYKYTFEYNEDIEEYIYNHK